MLYEHQETKIRMELVGRQQQHQQEENAFERKSTTRGTRKRMTISIVEENEDESPEIVDLSGMSLESLPVNPTINLGAISKLHLSNNNLQSIPESLTARLLNLVELDMHSNQLKSIPNSIGCLSKLKLLNISGNLLLSLPKTIENCRSLEELNANFNMLTHLPDTIGFELINLKKICINSNKIAYLPYSTSHLTNLHVLDVRLNCLRSLPDDLENLINLEILNISQNFQYLVKLPYSVGFLISLHELDVSYNKITELPDSIGCLKKLQKLSVEGNHLVSPPPEVVEQGIHAVKQYLCEKINGMHEKSPKKKSWLGKLARCSTFSGANIPRDDREDFGVPSNRTIDAIASPRFMGMLSPRRLLSQKTYFSK